MANGLDHRSLSVSQFCHYIVQKHHSQLNKGVWQSFNKTYLQKWLQPHLASVCNLPIPDLGNSPPEIFVECQEK
jgi:hypothetical protein